MIHWLCFLLGHDSRRDITATGQRVFLCDRCGHEEPQIDRANDIEAWRKSKAAK